MGDCVKIAEIKMLLNPFSAEPPKTKAQRTVVKRVIPENISAYRQHNYMQSLYIHSGTNVYSDTDIYSDQLKVYTGILPLGRVFRNFTPL